MPALGFIRFGFIVIDAIRDDHYAIDVAMDQADHHHIKQVTIK